MTTQDFLDKILWEGGPEDAVEYGLLPAQADDHEVGLRWSRIVDQYEGRIATGRSLDELTRDLFSYAGR